MGKPDFEYSGYCKALRAAGAEVLVWDEFGSYQGDWLAKVVYKGKIGFIRGGYGSCSGCDAFEGEFGWGDNKKSDYNERLIKFGQEYLDNMKTKEQFEAELTECPVWDLSSDDLKSWLKENG